MRRRTWRSGRVTGRPSSTWRRRTADARPAVRLPRPLERPARLPSLRLHADVRGGGARPAGEPRRRSARSNTEVVLVSCEPSAARQAWQAAARAEYTFASDFWPHGAAAKAYGVFNEETGAPVRGTFLIDKERNGDLVARADPTRPAQDRARARLARARSVADVSARRCGRGATAEAPRVVCLHGVTGHGRHFARLAGDGSRRLPRARTGPPRPRLLPVRAAVAHRRPPRGDRSRRSATSRRPGSATRSVAGSRSSSQRVRPELVERPRPPRPGDPRTPARRALRGRGNARKDRVVYDLFEEAIERRYEESSSTARPRELVADELREHSSSDRRSATGATATARRRWSRPTASWPVDAAAVRGRSACRRCSSSATDSYLPYDHLLDAHTGRPRRSARGRHRAPAGTPSSGTRSTRRRSPSRFRCRFLAVADRPTWAPARARPASSSHVVLVGDREHLVEDRDRPPRPPRA